MSIHTTEQADAAWLVVDNYREPHDNRLAAATGLLDWMHETDECPHPMGYRKVTELDVVWVCIGVLQTELERRTA